MNQILILLIDGDGDNLVLQLSALRNSTVRVLGTEVSYHSIQDHCNPLLGPAVSYHSLDFVSIYSSTYLIYPRIIVPVICLSQYSLSPTPSFPPPPPPRSSPSHCSTKHPSPLYLLLTFLIHTPPPPLSPHSLILTQLLSYPWPCSSLLFNQPASLLSSRGCGTCFPARYTHANPSLDSR